ncbi:Ankyrin [Terriglobus saanensis SP1PR4]|uniref:Ankyrin n=2 Tax=Terriglobus saanensis TaxID=870903 RepID=E8V032_TERSS|nr:Ankyrin [Terriglobus saanensis SP1PR4]
MSHRHLPVRPNLDQLKQQAKDLLRQIRSQDPAALEDFKQHYSGKVSPSDARLSDAQLILARSYDAPSWPRLVLACKLIDGIWLDDLELVRKILLKHPRLLHEEALVRKNSNWGPPMSYAANLGRDRIIEMLNAMGARDHEGALERATLQSQIGTARKLHAMMHSPRLRPDVLDGPAYTLSVSGTALLFELGARVEDDQGKSLAPVATVLETDSRKPEAKHRILEMYVQHGLKLPDTPTMALHRGRIDLLEEHLRRDPQMLRRTFRFEEIYPPELGCHDEVLATHGTPLAGATLLHMCVDYDEMEIARWLLDRGMPVDVKASVDADGFGGHTALFATVVSQPNLWMNRSGRPATAPVTQLLLDHGADANVRASLRKQLHPGYGEEILREFRDVTPLSYGESFQRKEFVNEAALRLIVEHGGHA